MQPTAWTEHEQIQEIHWWHRHKRDFLVRIAGQKQYRAVLEIGSGGGSLSGRLDPRALRVTTDIDARHVHGGGAVTRLPSLAFKDGMFDLVIAGDVLEHLENPTESLREIHRTMTPSGRCIITVPAWPALWSDHDRFYGHQKRYTLGILRTELESAGFQIQHLGWLFFLPLWPAALIRLAQRFTPRQKEERSASDFRPIPRWLNDAAYTYLQTIELPIAAAWCLPVGLTCAALALKPGNTP